MVRILAILMSFLIFLTSVRDLLTYGYYHFNQKYITEKYCLNIDKPAVMCFGKCYLTDKLTENQKKEQEKPVIPHQEERTNTNYIIPYELSIADFECCKKNKKAFVDYISSHYSFELHEDIFHPPERSV